MMALARCSFCGRSQNDVPRLVVTEASTAAICSPCTMKVLDIFTADDDDVAFELTPIGREVAERISGVQVAEAGPCPSTSR